MAPELRDTFLKTSKTSLELLAHPEVAEWWERPSRLAEWSVAGLSGHLARATTAVESYLNEATSVSRSPVSASTYFATVLPLQVDLDSDFHVAVRKRGEEQGSVGAETLVEELAATIERLEHRLASEAESRLIQVFQGVVLELDEYLKTRIIEMVVHGDDLAASVGVVTPEFPSKAMDVAITVLVELARERHGDAAVVTALTRRERDAVEALRVF